MESNNAGPASFSKPPIKLYLVIANICKISNVRQLLLTATAMDLDGVLVVGQGRNLQDDDLQLPSGFTQQVDVGKIQMLRFPKWNDCVQYLKAQSITLVGIEIDESAVVLDQDYFGSNQQQPLTSDTALFPGNEGQGIHPKHMVDCQQFVRIPQYGVGTASFNVNVATSMVLYRYQQERRRIQKQLLQTL
jgi:tRNA G18 (ribose-2'-O)-methylase SpoU